jgi:hypothetical protein
MSIKLILATLFALGGALDTLVREVSGLMTSAFLLLADVWVIVIVVVAGTIIIIIVIVIRTSRRQ